MKRVIRSKQVNILVVFAVLLVLFAGCSGDDGGVTYDANGGTAGTAPTDPAEYSSGDEVTVLDNTGGLRGSVIVTDKVWQRFIGWNTDSGATTALYTGGDTFTIIEDTTLYAIYTTGTDVLGKVGQAGGLVFYDAVSPKFWGQYLEAAPASTEWDNKEWGDNDTEIGGDAGLTGIGDGQAATDEIVAHMEGKSITGTPAQLCDSLIHNSYNDWFLPSKDALRDIYENLYHPGIGGFGSYIYWTSSEYSSLYAWQQNFNNGARNTQYKILSRRVRAVRAF